MAKRINYSRLEYTELQRISRVAIEKILEFTGKEIIEIKNVAWYKYGRYATQPLIFFFKDGSIYKITYKLKVIPIKEV